MKRLIPNFSNLFAAWASAGQYGSIAELEDADDVEPKVSKVHALPTARNGGAKRRSVVQPAAAAEQPYMTGSMLVKTRLG